MPDALLQSYRDLLKEAQLMPSTTLVFDGSCTKRWVNAICAFRNMHLITDQSVEMLKGELLQLLDELEEIAVAGQFRSGKPVSIYISDMDIEATYCYVAARHYRASCIETFSINSLRSADPGMFEHVKRWITSLSRFATLISCSGELQRIHFFKRQRAIVAELEREGLEPSPPPKSSRNKRNLASSSICLSCASNPDGFSTCVTFAGVTRPLHNPT